MARMGQKRPKMEHFSHPGRLVDIIEVDVEDYKDASFHQSLRAPEKTFKKIKLALEYILEVPFC